MKTVRFQSNERVDIPDMMALANLPLGEWRRQLRGVITGPDPAVITGFKVSATGPATSAVEVVVSNGVDWPSHAVATDGDSVGQLVGGIDDQGLPEGSATISLDFVGQPVGTYAVEVRYVMVPSDQQNRAFINPTTKVENTQQTYTRLVPQLELGFALAPTGGEWLHLADVAWGGVTVTSGNITDQRVFALEVGPDGLFQAADWGGAGGMPDPQRSTSRADFGENEIWPAIRAIHRQIQDLKGFNDSGLLDHFSRVRTVPRAGTGTVSSQQTRSIASMDTEELTVGDGVTTWGDFSGPTGLQLALDHVVLNKASMHKHVTIKVKTRTAFTSIDLFTLTTPVDLSGVRVTIDFVTGNNLRGRCRVDFAHGAGAFFTNTTEAYPLEIRNMVAAVPSGAKTVYPLYDGANGAGIVLRNVGYQVSASLSLPAITARAYDTLIENSSIYGDIILGGGLTSQPCRITGLDGNSSTLTFGARTRIRLYQTLGVSAETSENVIIEHSRFAQLDGRGASNVVVRNNTIQHGHIDGIILGRTAALSSKSWLIQDNVYQPSAQNSGGHVATNGALGTGWSVNCMDALAGTTGDRNQNITVSGVRMLSAVLNGTDSGIVRLGNVDGGIIERVHLNGIDHIASAVLHHSIRLDTCSRVTVRDCTWDDAKGSPTSAGFNFRAIDILGTSRTIRIRDCSFDAPAAIAATDNHHIYAAGGAGALIDMEIASCRFAAINDSTPNVNGGNITFNTSTSVRGIKIVNNHFESTGSAHMMRALAGATACVGFQITGNRAAFGTGRLARFDVAPTDVIIDSNDYTPGHASVAAFAGFNVAGALRVRISNNTLRADGSTGSLILFTGTGNANLQITDNLFDAPAASVLMRIADSEHVTTVGNYSLDSTCTFTATAPGPVNHIGWADTTMNRVTFA